MLVLRSAIFARTSGLSWFQIFSETFLERAVMMKKEVTSSSTALE